MLYKYTAHKYFESLINKGSFRIGTLRGYRHGKAGDMVSDPMEGSKRLSGSYLTMNRETVESSSSMSRFIGLSEGATINYLSMIHCTIEDPNYFIFSVSTQYSDDEHRKWHEQEGYDSCYRINFPKTFFKRITQTLRTVVPVRFLGLFRVCYYDEKSGMDWCDPKESLPAFVLKDQAHFSDQTEVRAVWKPLATGSIEPKNLCNSSLCSYVDLHRSRT